MAADPFVDSLLSPLGSADVQSAWRAFLERYSDIIYHVIRTFDRDPDQCADCFLFVCEHLAANDFRRLRKFDTASRASFPTWLYAVTRNLCLDFLRRKHGRRRVFAVAQRETLTQLLFELVFHRGLSAEEARRELSRRGMDVSFTTVDEQITALRQCMTSRQLWLLSSGHAIVDSLDAHDEDARVAEPADPTPDPESLAALRETHQQVSAALDRLSEADRLLVRLRYQEGLTLHQIANLVGLKDAQTVDRRLREIIDQLRQSLGIRNFVRGKARSASV